MFSVSPSSMFNANQIYFLIFAIFANFFPPEVPPLLNLLRHPLKSFLNFRLHSLFLNISLEMLSYTTGKMLREGWLALFPDFSSRFVLLGSPTSQVCREFRASPLHVLSLKMKPSSAPFTVSPRNSKA